MFYIKKVLTQNCKNKIEKQKESLWIEVKLFSGAPHSSFLLACHYRIATIAVKSHPNGTHIGVCLNQNVPKCLCKSTANYCWKRRRKFCRLFTITYNRRILLWYARRFCLEGGFPSRHMTPLNYKPVVFSHMSTYIFIVILSNVFFCFISLKWPLLGAPGYLLP